jgi:hypothetical protein
MATTHKKGGQHTDGHAARKPAARRRSSKQASHTAAARKEAKPKASRSKATAATTSTAAPKVRSEAPKESRRKDWSSSAERSVRTTLRQFKESPTGRSIVAMANRVVDQGRIVLDRLRGFRDEESGV